MKIIEKDGKRLVFDVIRRKYVALTPEEQVRQYFVNYLISEKGFPKEMIANEVSIKLHNTFKRCDTVIYNTDLTPLMIVECPLQHGVTRPIPDSQQRHEAHLLPNQLREPTICFSKRDSGIQRNKGITHSP